LLALVLLKAAIAQAAVPQAIDTDAATAQSTFDAIARDPDVSNIHGQLVPVGDQNQYRYSFRRWNLSTNPLGMVVGFYGVSLSRAVHNNVALKGDVTFLAPVDSDDTGIELSLTAPIYLRRAYQGPFIEPGVLVRRIWSESDGMYGQASTTSSQEVGPQVLAGWHWSWDSGLNLALALGVGRNLAHEDEAPGEHHDDSPLMVNGYMRVGYSF